MLNEQRLQTKDKHHGLQTKDKHRSRFYVYLQPLHTPVQSSSVQLRPWVQIPRVISRHWICKPRYPRGVSSTSPGS